MRTDASQNYREFEPNDKSVGSADVLGSHGERSAVEVDMRIKCCGHSSTMAESQVPENIGSQAAVSFDAAGNSGDVPIEAGLSYKTSTSRCEGGLSWADVDDEDGDEFFAADLHRGGCDTSFLNASDHMQQQDGYIGKSSAGVGSGISSSRNNSRYQSGVRYECTRSGIERRDGLRGGSGPETGARGPAQGRVAGGARQGGPLSRGTRDTFGDSSDMKTGRGSGRYGENRPKTRKAPTVSIVDGEEWQEVPIVNSRKHDAARLAGPALDMWESETERDNESKVLEHGDSREARDSDSSDTETSSEQMESESEKEEVIESAPPSKPEASPSAPKKGPPLSKKQRQEAKQNELEALNAVLCELAITDSPGSDTTAASLAKPDAVMHANPTAESVQSKETETARPKKKKAKDKAGSNEIITETKALEDEEDAATAQVVTLSAQQIAMLAKERRAKKTGSAGSNESIIAALASEAKKKKQAAADAARRKDKKKFQFQKQK